MKTYFITQHINRTIQKRLSYEIWQILSHTDMLKPFCETSLNGTFIYFFFFTLRFVAKTKAAVSVLWNLLKFTAFVGDVLCPIHISSTNFLAA